MNTREEQIRPWHSDLPENLEIIFPKLSADILSAGRMPALTHVTEELNFESPFLDGEIFVREHDAAWETHLATLLNENPFQRAFEQGPTAFIAPEAFEDEFVEEDEWAGLNNFAADEAEAHGYSEEAPVELENGIEKLYEGEEATYGEEEKPFLNELDEEDEHPIFEAETPPPLKVAKRPRPVPESDPVPFAPAPPNGSYWPIITKHLQGREVNFLDEEGMHVGSIPARMFLAERSEGTRYHIGIDLFANFNDPVVACQDGKIVNFYGFCCGKKITSWALLVDHGDVVVNYGELAPDSLDRAGGLKLESPVRAGQIIGFIGQNPGKSSMLHFETYKHGTKNNKSWSKKQPRPPELLNPTKYLLFLSEFGRDGRGLPVPSATQLPAEMVRFAQRILNATEGERLTVDGELGPRTKGALACFRRKYNLGPGGVLDAKTELALAQRAIEELPRRSLFQYGVLDAATKQVLSSFKSKHGLAANATLDAATRTALVNLPRLRE